jgi:hypothetical protein
MAEIGESPSPNPDNSVPKEQPASHDTVDSLLTVITQRLEGHGTYVGPDGTMYLIETSNTINTGSSPGAEMARTLREKWKEQGVFDQEPKAVIVSGVVGEIGNITTYEINEEDEKLVLDRSSVSVEKLYDPENKTPDEKTRVSETDAQALIRTLGSEGLEML